VTLKHSLSVNEDAILLIRLIQEIFHFHIPCKHIWVFHIPVYVLFCTRIYNTKKKHHRIDEAHKLNRFYLRKVAQFNIVRYSNIYISNLNTQFSL
jgi:hypothetical protein